MCIHRSHNRTFTPFSVQDVRHIFIFTATISTDIPQSYLTWNSEPKLEHLKNFTQLAHSYFFGIFLCMLIMNNQNQFVSEGFSMCSNLGSEFQVRYFYGTNQSVLILFGERVGDHVF